MENIWLLNTNTERNRTNMIISTCWTVVCLTDWTAFLKPQAPQRFLSHVGCSKNSTGHFILKADSTSCLVSSAAENTNTSQQLCHIRSSKTGHNMIIFTAGGFQPEQHLMPYLIPSREKDNDSKETRKEKSRIIQSIEWVLCSSALSYR